MGATPSVFRTFRSGAPSGKTDPPRTSWTSLFVSVRENVEPVIWTASKVWSFWTVNELEPPRVVSM